VQRRVVIAVAIIVAVAAVAATAFAAPAVSTSNTSPNPDLNPARSPWYQAAAQRAAAAAAASATANASKTPTYTPSLSSTATYNPLGTSPDTYDLSWTLPTAGKSGCLVCHGDQNLVRIQGGTSVSLYVSYETLQASAHANVPCTGCHADFAFKTPHANTESDVWKSVAKSSCKNCHKAEFASYTAGIHSPARPPGVQVAASSAKGKPVPLCGDCHGGHDIPVLKGNPEAQRKLHASGLDMCGQCHTAESGNYADYYHGAAYKEGAPDAPACWQCHKSHDILPSSDRRSSTYPDNLPETCAQCHAGDPNMKYATYGKIIHGKASVLHNNPLYKLYEQVGGGISGAWQKVTSVFNGQ
jgi:hypothetical protein